MAGVTISYKGSQIASMTSTGTKTLTTSGQYCEDNITVGYSAPSLESVTINARNLLSQNTTFDTLNLVLYQNDNFNITTHISTSNSYSEWFNPFIPIKLNEKIHLYMILSLLCDDIDETITVDCDYTVKISITDLTFTSSSQNSNINSFGVYYYNDNLRFSLQKKSGNSLLTQTSGQIIITKTVDGIDTVTLNLSDNPQYLNVYKSLAYRQLVYETSYRSEWCNSLTRINQFQFAGQVFSGSLNFNNVSNIEQYAFAFPWNGNGASVQAPVFEANFLNSQLSIFRNGTFISNGTLRGIYAPYVKTIDDFAFNYCRNLVSISFSQCTLISRAAFQSCSSLTSVYFPECISIKSYVFADCNKLTNASFPKCTTIGNYAFANCSNLTTISFPSCTTIGNYAFASCTSLTTAIFPSCITIGNYAFQSCSSLTSVYFPECISINSYAFASCSNLTTISFPSCTTIGNYAFASCTSLTTAIFPSCTTIGSSAFQSCSSLTSVYFPECISINSYAFGSCSNLTTISFPSCTTIGNYAFASCTSLTTAIFPSCTTIGSSAFYKSFNLTTISFPVCASIGYYAFYQCSSLTIVSFSTCTTISSYAFSGCSKLSQAYFMGSSIVSIGTNIFYYTPIDTSSYLGYFGSIYVPSSLLTSYKTATNWATYSNRMVGI